MLACDFSQKPVERDVGVIRMGWEMRGDELLVELLLAHATSFLALRFSPGNHWWSCRNKYGNTWRKLLTGL
jgi:hypothetical protein